MSASPSGPERSVILRRWVLYGSLQLQTRDTQFSVAVAFYASGTGYKIEYLIIVYQVQYKALYEFRMNAKRTQTNHEFS